MQQKINKKNVIQDYAEGGTYGTLVRLSETSQPERIVERLHQGKEKVWN
jgi:hypothetical protein